MIGFLKKRKLRRAVKAHLHAARHARHMREDIADPKKLEALKAAEAGLCSIRDTGQGDIEKAMDRLASASDQVYPLTNTSGMRENVEVVIVALAAAMAIRAFFLEPFKIPTGSMQPTLNGITTEVQAEAGLFDHQPLKLVKWLLTGTSYKEFRAKVTGSITRLPYGDRDGIIVEIAGVPHQIPVYMRNQFRPQNYYSKGDVICSAKVVAGDHILVNKMKYNFMRPERGDISVFDTRNVDHPDVREDTYYIKRMVGLSGEKIQIQSHRIVARGEVVREPAMFEKIATDPIYSGGHNVTPGSLLESEDDSIQLADDEYLMMGDNTVPGMSLDGRFFGGVLREDFRGPAFFVYWPFREHWGIVR